MPKTLNCLQKWRNFSASGHTDYVGANTTKLFYLLLTAAKIKEDLAACDGHD